MAETGTGKPPVESKVKAAAAGAGAGAGLGLAIAEAINWAVDRYVLTPGVEGDLPKPVSGLVVVAVAAGLAWLAGYTARHTRRPDLPAPAADVR